VLNRLLHLLTFFLVTSIAYADTGVGYYAMLHKDWPCKNSLSILPQNPHISVLWNTFGKDTKCLSQFLSRAGGKTLQIHTVNEVCQRNKRCGDYEFLSNLSVSDYNNKLIKRNEKLLNRLRKYHLEILSFLDRNLTPDTQCIISPGLESNLSYPAARVLIDEATKMFSPRCQISWNPLRGGPIPNTIHELHGENPRLSPPCIANLDGVDIDFKGRPAILPQSIWQDDLKFFIKDYSKCVSPFLWIAEFNGIGRGGFIDPRQRKNFPSLDTFKKVGKYLNKDF